MNKVYKVVHTQTIEYGIVADSLEKAKQCAEKYSQYDLLWDEYIRDNCVTNTREVSYDPDYRDECLYV